MASNRNLNAPGGDVEVSNLPAHKISVRAHRFIMLICLFIYIMYQVNSKTACYFKPFRVTLPAWQRLLTKK